MWKANLEAVQVTAEKKLNPFCTEKMQSVELPAEKLVGNEDQETSNVFPG